MSVEGVNSRSNSFERWGAEWQIRTVRQRVAHDCGVACMAMVTGAEYEACLATFRRLGLDRSPKPFSSNFRQLMAAIASGTTDGAGALSPKMMRWRGWDSFEGLGIIKVHNGSPRGWHWVVAERHPRFGLVARDPAQPFLFVAHPLPGGPHGDLSLLSPYGNWIQVAGASERTPQAC